MPCYFPIQGFRSRTRNISGKYGIVFSASDGFIDKPVKVPCGQCIGCRLERSRQWAIRCVHEASLYEKNSFVTLTYDDAHLPKDMSLNKVHFQNFMKYLRRDFGSGIRFFQAGEYGERFGRPHYHACLFNFDFDDKKIWKVTDVDNRLYTSEVLSRLWTHGFSTCAEVTFESAAYVARYAMKKVTGDGAEDHYTYIDTNTGEFYQRVREYVTMSRRPGIGKPWLDKYQSDVYPDDFVVIRGRKMKAPKYYDKVYFGDLKHISDRYSRLFDLMEAEDKKRLLVDRLQDAVDHKEDSTPERLRVRERVVKSRIKQLKRSLK